MTELLSSDARAKINKYNGQKGAGYERDVAKAIAGYHGLDWKDAFLRTKRTTGGQVHGDLLPIKEMAKLWYAAKLGPIECKNRNTQWSFNEIFVRPDTCWLIKYWEKSNEDTSSTDSIVFFTKAGVTNLVLKRYDADKDWYEEPYIRFFTKTHGSFVIQTLPKFLTTHWPLASKHTIE